MAREHGIEVDDNGNVTEPWGDMIVELQRRHENPALDLDCADIEHALVALDEVHGAVCDLARIVQNLDSIERDYDRELERNERLVFALSQLGFDTSTIEDVASGERTAPLDWSARTA